MKKTNFGVLRQKVLDKLTELYLNENKNELKKLVKEIKTNKKFAELHLFYEDVEKKIFGDKDVAELFVEEVIKLIKGGNKQVFPNLENFVSDIENVTLNECHVFLDTLMEEQTLLNLDRIVEAKKGLIDYLLKEKVTETIEEEELPKIENTNLLNVVLVNDFNSKYSDMMNEEEKETFKKIMSMSSDELNESTKNLKNEINTKINSLLTEDVGEEVKDKLTTVLSEMKTMSSNRYNYYRLLSLKDGLD